MAVQSIQLNPASAPLWQQVVSRYHPSFLLECAQAIKWSKDMVSGWLRENMFAGNHGQAAIADNVVNYLSDHSITATHSRHLPASKCEEIGLKVEKLEDDEKLQDLVLTVHHAYMHTFSMSQAVKIIENHLGVATVLLGVGQQIPFIGQGQMHGGFQVHAPVMVPMPAPVQQEAMTEVAELDQVIDPVMTDEGQAALA